MTPDPTKVPHPPLATVEESCERDNACLEIELDGRAGLGRVVDARLFQPARREYAQRLLEALCEHPGVRKAEVDLASSTCRVEFDLASNSRAVMGGILVEALRTASARAGKTPWWRRSPRWSTLTAYRSFGDLSLWKRTRTIRGVNGFSIGGARATAPRPPVWPTAWRASTGSSAATCRYGRTGSRSIAVRALDHWPVTRWTAWSGSWRGERLPIRGKPP